MKKDLFDYKDYKAFLKALILAQPNAGRGFRMKIATEIGCPISHISQVLGGSSHLTPEQAESLNGFLGHTQEQAQFFLLLIQIARAGTSALRKRLDKQIQTIVEKRLVLKDRLEVKHTLSKEDQALFYSSWLYGAVHVMLSVENLQTNDAISRRLGISLKKTSEILDFLVSIGLATPQSAGTYSIGTARIHLGNDSPHISKFHTNWRMQSIRSFDRDEIDQDLHYSSAISVSADDFVKIKTLTIKHIEEIKRIIKESPAENAYCFAIDLFSL